MDKDIYIHTYTHKDTYIYIYVCKDTYIHCDNTYNGILPSHKKNEIMSFTSIYMDLEIVILNEISQANKDKYHMILLIYEPIYKTETESQI